MLSIHPDIYPAKEQGEGMTGKCKWSILCPECIEKTGHSRIFRSPNHFRQHLAKHAVPVTRHIPDTVAAWGGDFIPAHDIEVISTECWWERWAKQFLELNGWLPEYYMEKLQQEREHTGMQRDNNMVQVYRDASSTHKFPSGFHRGYNREGYKL